MDFAENTPKTKTKTKTNPNGPPLGRTEPHVTYAIVPATATATSVSSSPVSVWSYRLPHLSDDGHKTALRKPHLDRSAAGRRQTSSIFHSRAALFILPEERRQTITTFTGQTGPRPIRSSIVVFRLAPAHQGAGACPNRPVPPSVSRRRRR
ncbi:hypothetical protein Ct61P_01169 [Colletotrichum tofieldiae]|nr:hypothetical protein Ct61P_01169 [Colletotrichum tofieldiae]